MLQNKHGLRKYDGHLLKTSGITQLQPQYCSFHYLQTIVEGIMLILHRNAKFEQGYIMLYNGNFQLPPELTFLSWARQLLASK